MKNRLKWFITIAFILVLINSYFTISEFFTDEDTTASVGYFEKTDYGDKSSKDLNIANAKNSNTIQNGKNNVRKSEVLLKKVNKLF